MGCLGPVLRSSDGMRCVCINGRTVIRGHLSREDLHRLLERIDGYGVTVVDLYSMQL
jgi:hypothetical protein